MPVQCKESNFLPFPGIPTEAHKIETSVLLEILGREETFSLPSRPLPKERGTYLIAWLGESHWLRVAQPPWVFLLSAQSAYRRGLFFAPCGNRMGYAVTLHWGKPAVWDGCGENLQFGMGAWLWPQVLATVSDAALLVIKLTDRSWCDSCIRFSETVGVTGDGGNFLGESPTN